MLLTQGAEVLTRLESTKGEKKSPDELGREVIIAKNLPEWRAGDMAHESGQMSFMRIP
ncbi:hypothetical protein [Ktedonosporobacter rubrisoli]|uniref:hypothetical protein n=1 Tax=Ktedonosporobacter rubrisoli TaxID=2509675 RepID=UPI0013EE41F4|nr:hypothetical protein [Ktedonosporobacter rubrisoli]